MEGFWSLTFFTIFSQAAVGAVIFKAIFSNDILNNNELELSIWKIKSPFWVLKTLGLLLIAVFLSLLHLSAPFSSYYAITNPMTSWLSREILTLGLFGVTVLGIIFIRTRLMRIIAGITGVFLVYVIAKVYIIPTQATWDTWLTFANFLSSALVLGASFLLFLDSFEYKGNSIKSAFSTIQAANIEKLTHSSLPTALLLSVVINFTFVAWQFARPEAILTIRPFVVFFALVSAGLFIGYVALMKSKKKAPVFTIGLAFILIWLGEISGRIVFYSANVYFGM